MVNRAAERGFALLLALGISFLVAAIAIVIGRTLDTRSGTELLELRVIKLRTLTDAALAEALAHLNQDSSYDGQPSHPLGDGTIASSVTPREDGSSLVTATADWRGWAATLQANVRFDGHDRVHVESWQRTLRVGTARSRAGSATSRLD